MTWSLSKETRDKLIMNGVLWPCTCMGYCRHPDRCSGDLCERCGSSDWIETNALSQARRISRMCGRCGQDDLRAMFTRFEWAGGGPIHVVVSSGPGTPTFADHDRRPVPLPQLGVIEVWSGPPAPEPYPPTPEEILTACGVDPATVFV